MRTLSIFSLAFVLCGPVVMAQRPNNDLYPYNYTSVSPTFAGVDGLKVTAMGSVFAPGGPDAGFIGFEAPIKNINSGVGVNFSGSGLGPVKDRYVNLLYNYQWNIGQDGKMIVGAKLGVYKNTLDNSKYIPLDPNDPLLISAGKTSYLNPMAGVGALYKTERLFLGVLADNLVRDRTENMAYLNFNPANIIVSYFFGVNFILGEKVTTTHSVYSNANDGNVRTDLNNSVVFKKWLIAGVSFRVNDDNISPSANAGVSIKEKFKIMIMLYSRTRDVDKDFSGQLMLQFSL